MKNDDIEALVRRLVATLPDGVKSLSGEVEAGFRSTLKTAFERMDLVTREEFEIQRGVLAKTRAKIEALEEKLSALEDTD